MLRKVVLLVFAGLMLTVGGNASATLVAHYTFDNAGDRANDDSGSGHDLSSMSTSNATPGKIGAGMESATSGGMYVNENNDGWFNHNAYTFSMWFNPIADTGGYHGLAGGGAASNTSNGATRMRWSGAYIDIYPTVSGSTYQYRADTSIDRGEGVWHHLAFAWQSGEVPTMYVDGKAQPWNTGYTTGALTGSWELHSSRQYLTFGAVRYDNTYPLGGNLDDIGVWNNRIGAQDVALTHGVGVFYGLDLEDSSIASLLNTFNGGASTMIGADEWVRADGIGGTTGDIGGSVAGVDAYIILDGSGNGVQLIPEPATVALLGLGSLVLLRKRR